MIEIKLGNKIVGGTCKPYFIADIAANHDGDINRAYKLIELAKESGADAAKFQNFKAEKIVSDIGFKTMKKKLSHQSSWGKTVFEVYKEATLPDDWSEKLKYKCDEIGIEYMTSPYDVESVDLVDKYLNCYKIGSGDITWIEILEYIAKKNKPLILATGASEEGDVTRAVEAISKHNNRIILMQCNTNYTAKEENFQFINLNVLDTYRKLFPNVILGLSDHTRGHATVLGAITLGARVIEKHFTDDNDRIGPDHKFSMTPKAWMEMVRESNYLFSALGDGKKRVEKNEMETLIVQQRGLYYTKDKKRCEVILENDIIALRPLKNDGFKAFEATSLIGKTALKDVVAGQPILQDEVE